MFSDETTFNAVGAWECTGNLEVTTNPDPYKTVVEQGNINNFSTVEDLIRSLLYANFTIVDYRDM